MNQDSADFPSLDLSQRLPSDEPASVWASFADMMTVVVMIFLMACCVVVIKNFELVGQLKQSVIDTELANKRAEDTNSEKAALQAQVRAQERAIVHLTDKLQESLVAQQRLQAQVIASSDKSERHAFTAYQQANALRAQHQQLTQLRASLIQTEQQMTAQQHRFAKLEGDRAALRERVRAQESDYGQLKSKYERLLRPARSSKGKVVVPIRYNRTNGGTVIALQRPGRPMEIVSKSRLHDTLRQLAAEHPNKLYMKIIFPGESEISHREAWTFTNDILQRYDYYYR